jgi:hypothetical protein
MSDALNISYAFFENVSNFSVKTTQSITDIAFVHQYCTSMFQTFPLVSFIIIFLGYFICIFTAKHYRKKGEKRVSRNIMFMWRIITLMLTYTNLVFMVGGRL